MVLWFVQVWQRRVGKPLQGFLWCCLVAEHDSNQNSYGLFSSLRRFGSRARLEPKEKLRCAKIAELSLNQNSYSLMVW